MIVLGLESSCDETAVAIVESNRKIHANIVLSQWAAHAPFGGVVPEIAARAHMEAIEALVAEAFTASGLTWKNIDAIAATSGPGLIGGVIVGLTAAKGMALATGKPLLAINHLEGHALTPRLVEDIPFPYLLLLVSGGHTQLIIVEAIGQYRLLGSSMDDAVGEAFDKTAKILGLGYPGGPAVEKIAQSGDAKRFALPRSMVGTPHCNFSFSGLKTAVSRTAEALPKPLQPNDIADLCASFQATVGDILCDRVKTALLPSPLGRGAGGEGVRALVVAGGVAANKYLAQQLKILAEKHHLNFCAPPMKLCTDNAAMIAWAGLERLASGDTQNALNAIPKARWPLKEVSI